MSMISELVDRLRTEAKSMGAYGTCYMATLLMRSADTIEMLSEKAREPKQGEWVATDVTDEWYGLVYKCNLCGSEVIGGCDNYCPNCGVKMKGADDD